MLEAGNSSLGIIVILSVAILLVIHAVRRANAIPLGLRLPPGPPGKPIIGNAADMPTHREWETFSAWAKKYGDLVYIKVFGQPMVFVNTANIAYEMFEKRSSIYSDRGDSPMLNDLMGFDWHITFMHYGEWWRRHRKLFHQRFHPTAATEYYPIQTRQTQTLLKRLYESPEDFAEHLRHTAGAIIIEIVYGIKVLDKGDPYIDTAEKGMGGMTVAGNPGAFLVDTLPILKHVPEWIPGAGFRKRARVWRQSITEMSVAPFLAVKNALNAGTAGPSFTASFLQEAADRCDTPADEEDIIRGAGSSAYAAGSDTTVSALHTFMLAMRLYPEVQKRGQAELDAVVGADRLPNFDDRESLPYINAICKEVLRWQPVVPLAVAHRVTQDDVYGSYFIPKGTIIVGNAWNMLHDEKVYGPETGSFKPERFLVPGVKTPQATWGFGRICPGRYLADNSVFIGVAYILKVFDITPAYDSNGAEIPVKAAFTSGFMSHPESFRCEIRPRSEAAKILLERTDE